jgi:hypothetical protein
MNRPGPRIASSVVFDTERCPFAALFLERIHRRAPLTGLCRLHEIADEQCLDSVYRECYDLMGERAFVTVYEAFLREIVAPHLGVPFLFQRKPGVRIHLPGTRTVQYHTDEWYGHGKDVLNCWMPLTDAFASNSLYVASLDDSLREVGRLEAEKATMAAINDRLAKVVRPLNLPYGEVYVFSAQCVHGTEQNRTGLTRVSLDFRLLPEGGDHGTKPVAEYYRGFETGAATTGNLRAEEFRACVYLFGGEGFSRHVSNANQRLVCVSYAKTHGIQILADETEIRTMAHHPTLLALAEGSGTHRFNAVILFSVLCLPRECEDRRRIYNAAQENGTTLFFANEQVTFAEAANANAVEEMRQRLLT